MPTESIPIKEQRNENRKKSGERIRREKGR